MGRTASRLFISSTEYSPSMLRPIFIFSTVFFTTRSGSGSAEEESFMPPLPFMSRVLAWNGNRVFHGAG